MPGNPQATVDSTPSILGSFELIFYSFNRHIPPPSPAAHALGGTVRQSATEPVDGGEQAGLVPGGRRRPLLTQGLRQGRPPARGSCPNEEWTPCLPHANASEQCGLARGWGPGQADSGRRVLCHTHTHTHVCTQSTPMHIHLHAPTHYTRRHTTRAHTLNVRILSPYTTRTHPEGTHRITAPQGGMPSTQHPCTGYQKCPLVPKAGQ